MNYGKHSAKRRAKKVDAKGTKIRKKFGVTFFRVILVCILFLMVAGICAGVGVMKGIVDSAPDISSIDVTPTGFSTTVLAKDGTETATLVGAGANRQYVTIAEIPVDLQHAFVAIEDSRFYEHNGIDLYGIGRAFVNGVTSGGKFNEGASTITQQLIKNNVLTSWTSETSFIEKIQRKVQEQYLALELEKQVHNKDWILENYLNTINLGSNTLGVQAASQRYFGKDVSELTLSEDAVIAAITQNPYGYNPIRFPEENAKRRKTTLDYMKKDGYITQEQYDEAMADDVYSRIAEYNSTTEDSVNSYFVDALIDQVVEDLVNDKGYTETEAYKAIYQGGLTIQSTQDLAIQQVADEEVNNPDNYPSDPKYSFILAFQVKKEDGSFQNYTNQTMLRYYKEVNNDKNYSINYSSEEACYAAIEEYKQDVLSEGGEIVEGSESVHITLQPQVATTVMDQSTGEVLAIVGGRGEKVGNRTLNRATNTARQPGSCFKVLSTYAPALDAGDRTLASVEYDAPFSVGDKTFNNYDFTYRGYTNYRNAIRMSYNIVTVKALQRIGVNLGYQYLEDFGFTTLCDNDKNLALALGGITNGVKNVELTAAYATIANGGVYNEPIFYTTIYDHSGNVLIDKTFSKDTHRVLKEETAWLLTDAMKSVLTSGTGTSAHFGTGMAQAGKTGTTTGNRDSVFAAYTPYYTCAVWGGYDDNAIENGSTAYPKTIWRQIMKRIHEDLEDKDFTKPSNITSASVCKESGLRPIEGVCEADPRGSTVYTEYFEKGTVPSETCDHHTKLRICKDSNLIANEFCPEENVEERVYVIGSELETGTTEDEVIATSEFLEKTCDLHNAENTKPAVDPNAPTDGTQPPADGSQPTDNPAHEGETGAGILDQIHNAITGGGSSGSGGSSGTGGGTGGDTSGGSAGGSSGTGGSSDTGTGENHN